MRRSILAAVCLTFGLTSGAMAQSNAAVVELFTSQGCSSCPPADAFLAEIADREDVIALALHVDYWDYIGWADTFASPAFTARQHAYARAAQERTVYTPQVVVGGADHVIGSSPAEVSALIARQQAAPVLAALTVTRTGGSVAIRATAAAGLGGSVDVQLIRYLPQASVAIERGENAGRTILYRNIVTRIDDLGSWDGSGTLAMQAPLAAGEPVVVVLQRPASGPIVAAAQLR